jgi:hypothetical protein
MGLSYTGMSCLLITRVIGYRRVPDPPAKMIPFMVPAPYLNPNVTKVEDAPDARRPRVRL